MLPAVFLLASSCSKVTTGASGRPEGPVTVGISVASEGSRTIIDEDWVNVNWQACDELAVWAKNSSGAYTLDATKFGSSGAGRNAMVFTSELPSPMGDDTYVYTACYPYPSSVNGTAATFAIPSEQDGRLSGGADIMVSDAVQYGPLTPVSPDQEYSGLRLNAHHLLHILKFYLPEGFDGLKGEAVKRIKVEMPSDITGELTVDMANTLSQPSLTKGSKTECIVVDGGLAISTADKRNYACCSIFPREYKAGDVMTVTLYSDNWTGRVDDIPLAGRNMQPGHATPVALRIHSTESHYTLRFTLAGNNLGEPVQKITFATDKGKFGDGGAATYVWTPGGNIAVGDEVVFDYTVLSNFQALGGARISLTYDSEYVTSTQTITLPSLSGVNSYTARMTVPYLLWEDFSGVEGFSSHDEYTTSSTGNNYSYTFRNLPGWSGGRVGGKAGNCIRIAGRRESGAFIDAHYPARVESAPLPTIKKPVTVEVTFRYGTNEDGINKYGQTFKVGYVTSAKTYASGDTDGVYPYSLFTDVRTGSWDNKPSECKTTFEIPAGSSDRISWKDDPKGKADFASNTTSWLYIDDVVVKVKQ